MFKTGGLVYFHENYSKVSATSGLPQLPFWPFYLPLYPYILVFITGNAQSKSFHLNLADDSSGFQWIFCVD